MHRVACLPQDATASGQRVGALNEMVVGGVSAEFVAMLSGHDFEDLSKVWHYVNPTLALMVPGGGPIV